jgi:hypothetical protein
LEWRVKQMCEKCDYLIVCKYGDESSPHCMHSGACAIRQMHDVITCVPEEWLKFVDYGTQ